MKAIPDLKTIRNRFKFPSFRHRVKALPKLNARNYNIAAQLLQVISLKFESHVSSGS